MSDRFQTLEEKVKRLLAALDHLESENRSFRSLVDKGGKQLSRQEIISQVESLKLEKEKLEKKLERVEQSLGRVIVELDRLEI